MARFDPADTEVIVRILTSQPDRRRVLCFLACQPRPASLLCHSHDERLWNLKSFVVRGRFERGEGGWKFASERFILGGGIGGAWGTAKAVIGMRRSATRYLQKRDVARPLIPWEDIEAIKG